MFNAGVMLLSNYGIKQKLFLLSFKILELSVMVIVLYKAVLTSYDQLPWMLGDQCHIYFYLMCTVIHNCLSSGSPVSATDVELYKNMTKMVYIYYALLWQIFTLITTIKIIYNSKIPLIWFLVCFSLFYSLTSNFSFYYYSLDTALLFSYIKEEFCNTHEIQM